MMAGSMVCYCIVAMPLTGMPPMLPVTVTVVPLGALIVNGVAAEDPAAIDTLDGSPDMPELPDSSTVTF